MYDVGYHTFVDEVTTDILFLVQELEALLNNIPGQ
jgi:hypothetical protein